MTHEHQRESTPYKPPFYEKYLDLSDLLHKIGLTDSCNTMSCLHNNGCLFHIINQTFKGLALGYSGKTALNFVGLLLNFKKTLKSPIIMILSALFNKTSLRFALFPGIYNFTLQIITCGLRRKNINPKLQSFISGFLAGFLALATRQNDNRKVWAIFLIARAIDCFYHSLCNRKIIKKSKYDYVMLLCFMQGVNAYFYSCEPECLPDSYNRFLRKFSFEHPADIAFRRVWIEKNNLRIMKLGYEPHNADKGLLIDFKRKKQI